MNEIISIDNLSKKYKKDFALKDVTMSINKGDICGLIGKNGAGKTTLLKSIVGLILPTYGQISIQGSIDENSLALSRKNIGYYIESGMFKYLNAYENLMYRCKSSGIKNESQEINRVLDMMKMNNVKKPFGTYSMGMKQRVEIAAALVGFPDIVILDEPLNGLDTEGIFEFKNIIKDINQSYNTTFIISSHVLSELEYVSDKFVFFDEGKLIRNMDSKQLAKECSRQLIVKSDDTKKAVVLLEQKLDTTNYSVTKDDEIILSDFVDEPQVVADMLYSNGLHIQKLQPYTITLEEFFINMIGGR